MKSILSSYGRVQRLVCLKHHHLSLSTHESLTDDRCSSSSHDENLFRYHMSSTSIAQRDGAHGTSAVTAYRSCIPCTDVAKRVKMSRRLVPYGAIQHGIFFRFILMELPLSSICNGKDDSKFHGERRAMHDSDLWLTPHGNSGF